MSIDDILREYQDAVDDLEERLEVEEERADEMQRLVYVVYTTFAEHLPAQVIRALSGRGVRMRFVVIALLMPVWLAAWLIGGCR